MAQRGSDKHGPRQDDDPASFTGREPGANAQTVADAMTGRVIALPIDASAADAAIAMRNNEVGDVLVTYNDSVRGLITDRDLVVRVVAAGLEPENTSLDDICSEDVATVFPTTTIEDAVAIMRNRAVRRLPVVDDDNRPIGVVTIGDIALARQPDSALADITAAAPNR